MLTNDDCYKDSYVSYQGYTRPRPESIVVCESPCFHPCEFIVFTTDETRGKKSAPSGRLLIQMRSRYLESVQ